VVLEDSDRVRRRVLPGNAGSKDAQGIALLAVGVELWARVGTTKRSIEAETTSALHDVAVDIGDLQRG
jgi:hypothetical protein